MSRLFVGGLAWATTDDSLKNAFSQYGEVTEAKVIMDFQTGRSRGFGFVGFATEEEAQAAVNGLDGQEIDGRNVKVNVAEQRGGGGGGRGPPRSGGNNWRQ